MLYWAAIFLVVALVAGFFGFAGVPNTFVEIAQIIFFIFLVLFVIALVIGLIRGRRPRV